MTKAESDGGTVVSTGRAGTSRRRGRRVIAVFAIVCASVVLGGDLAQAHQWSNYHWRRGGSSVYVYVWNGCSSSHASVCEAARSDVHYRPHPVYLINVSYHTDISLLTTSDSSAGWYGLAEIWWDQTHGAPHIGHGHATLNTYYSQGSTTNQQGTVCQEIGHTLGLTHAPTGDCMAKSYYSPWTTKFADANGTSHPSADLRNMYSTPHH